jgi:hypothetical protein
MFTPIELIKAIVDMAGWDCVLPHRQHHVEFRSCRIDIPNVQRDA